MRRPLVAALTAVAVLAPACGGDDDGATSGTDAAITVTDAWARTTPPGVSIGAVYLTATSDVDDELVGADVAPSIAARVQLHSTDSSGGLTSMEELRTMSVPAGGQLVLAPIGNHLMLVDLTGPLTSGTSFEITLHFAHAGDEDVNVNVQDDAP